MVKEEPSEEIQRMSNESQWRSQWGVKKPNESLNEANEKNLSDHPVKIQWRNFTDNLDALQTAIRQDFGWLQNAQQRHPIPTLLDILHWSLLSSSLHSINKFAP